MSLVQEVATAAWTKTTLKTIGWLTLSTTLRSFTKNTTAPASCQGKTILVSQAMSETMFYRADLWALAGIVAVDEGITNANVACESAKKACNCTNKACKNKNYACKSDDCTVPASGLVFQGGRKVARNSFYVNATFSLWRLTHTLPNLLSSLFLFIELIILQNW